MSKPEYILRPANPYFIFFSLTIAFLLNLIPLGWLLVSPDFVALVLLFWNVHQPRIIGIGIAFILGVMMDVHDACLLGEHGLAYTLLLYGGILVYRRISLINLGMQIFYVTPLLIGAQIVPFIICMIVGFTFPIWNYLINGFTEIVLWPVISYLLLIPQHQPVDPDDTRPI
ncbi:MAG: rod shape-determining protein MreD [Burkholderia sp.]|nr:rod shape-determining protein MreD [Burkholderia sp.]